MNSKTPRRRCQAEKPAGSHPRMKIKTQHPGNGLVACAAVQNGRRFKQNVSSAHGSRTVTATVHMNEKYPNTYNTLRTPARTHSTAQQPPTAPSLSLSPYHGCGNRNHSAISAHHHCRSHTKQAARHTGNLKDPPSCSPRNPQSLHGSSTQTGQPYAPLQAWGPLFRQPQAQIKTKFVLHDRRDGEIERESERARQREGERERER